MASSSLLAPMSVVSFFARLSPPPTSRHRAYGPHQGGTSPTQGDAVAPGMIRSRVEFRPFTVLSRPLKATLMTFAAAVSSHQPRQHRSKGVLPHAPPHGRSVSLSMTSPPKGPARVSTVLCRLPVDVGTRQEGKPVLWERERQNVTTNAPTITGGEAFEKPNGQRTPTARAPGDASAGKQAIASCPVSRSQTAGWHVVMG